MHTPFSIRATTQSPKTQKKPALKQSSSKPNKNISPSPILTPSSAPSSLIPRKKVLVPIGFETEEMEAVIMIDILRHAGAEVTLASVEEQLEVEASGGTRLVANTFISSRSYEIFDLVALPGGVSADERLHMSRILRKLLTEQASAGRILGAVCSSPAILQGDGLLEDRQATAHPL